MVVSAIAGIFIVAVVCGVGLSAASADSSDDLARAGGFGFDSATQTATAATQISVPNDEPAPQVLHRINDAVSGAAVHHIAGGPDDEQFADPSGEYHLRDDT